MSDVGPVHFLNLEYFFRLIYTIFGSGVEGDLDLYTTLVGFWSLAAVIGYLVAIVALGVLIYSLWIMKVTFQQEEHLFETIEFSEADKEVDHSRWNHVVALIESTQENDWRQAIIEADIMLEEVLDEQGYKGETVGDRLKLAVPERFKTLNRAWEAHKIRNEIAHQGSAFKLDDNLAYRTIQHYEAVFREFNTI